MRILTVHNTYLVRGGEDEVRERQDRLLRERGHVVDQLTESNDRVRELGALRTAFRTVWSRESYARVRAALRRQSYAVMDVHNTFPLISPAAYYAARAERVAVVQTLHNYRLLCPSATFYRAGRVCEDCLGRTPPWPGVVHGCYRASRPGTAAVAAMLTLHRLRQTWTDLVDVYVALTEFARRKFIQGGLPAEKIVVKPHFLHPDPGPGEHRGEFALFVGRLAPEKGLDTLLAAWQGLAGRVPLKIVGDGPLADRVASAAARLPGVDWLGRKPARAVQTLMGQATMLVFPSEWYETFGLVTIEAFASGLPVIAADIGAIAELVDHGRTGLRFTPGVADELASCVQQAWTDRRGLANMGREARQTYESRYTADCNYQLLMQVYETAIARAGGRR